MEKLTRMVTRSGSGGGVVSPLKKDGEPPEMYDLRVSGRNVFFFRGRREGVSRDRLSPLVGESGGGSGEPAQKRGRIARYVRPQGKNLDMFYEEADKRTLNIIGYLYTTLGPVF